MRGSTAPGTARWPCSAPTARRARRSASRPTPARATNAATRGTSPSPSSTPVSPRACPTATLPDRSSRRSTAIAAGWRRRRATRQSQQPRISGEARDAVWLPDERIARAWMEYVKTGAVDDTTPPPAPFAVKAITTPEGAFEVTWDAAVDLDSGLRAFIVRRDGRELARVPEKPVGPVRPPLVPGVVLPRHSREAPHDHAVRRHDRRRREQARIPGDRRQ